MTSRLLFTTPEELDLQYRVLDEGTGVNKLPNAKSGPASIEPHASKKHILSTLTAALAENNTNFQETYVQAEKALIAKVRGLIATNIVAIATMFLISLFIYASILDIPQTVAFGSTGFGQSFSSKTQDVSTAIWILNVLEVLGIGFVIFRIVTISSLFFQMRAIRMGREARERDTQSRKVDKIMSNLRESARSIRVGDNGVLIFGDNSGKINTGTEITITKGEKAADVVALLLAYTKDHAEANGRAKEIAIELSKKKPNKKAIFSAWTAIVALLPSIQTVVEIANGVANLIGV